MRPLILAVGVAVTTVIGGCAPQPDAAESSDPPPLSNPTPDPAITRLAQELPVSAELQFRGQTIGLEVAKTAEQDDVGLMGRTSLAPDRGMLFRVDPPRDVNFWMKDTLIPLDMIFLRDDTVVSVAEDVQPCPPATVRCPDTNSMGVVDQVVEVAAGTADRIGIATGDRVTITAR